MRRTKYVLHPFLEFITSDEVESLDVNVITENNTYQKIKQKELFVLSNKRRDMVFFINPTIKIFLELFQTPQSFQEALSSFSTLLETPVADAEPIVQSFFDDMRDRDILVTTILAQKANTIQEIEGFKAGELFENFTIITPLSINRFLHVYLAEKDDERVVLKMLVLPEGMPEKGRNYYKRFFNQEFELITEVGNHPHICQLKAWNPEKNYAVLEYIDGQSLRKLAASGVLQWTERLYIFEQVLKALAALHHQQILHGDIHASNFLIQKDGSVKLIDFDLANRERLYRHEILHEGGVHEYIAPEKIDDNSFDMVKERSDYRSEVYQLGVILYYLLYQKLPFKALSWQELISKILHEEPEYPLSISTGEDINASVLGFLKQCLSKNPKNRFANASEASLTWNSLNFLTQTTGITNISRLIK